MTWRRIWRVRCASVSSRTRGCCPARTPSAGAVWRACCRPPSASPSGAPCGSRSSAPAAGAWRSCPPTAWTRCRSTSACGPSWRSTRATEVPLPGLPQHPRQPLNVYCVQVQWPPQTEDTARVSSAPWLLIIVLKGDTAGKNCFFHAPIKAFWFFIKCFFQTTSKQTSKRHGEVFLL